MPGPVGGFDEAGESSLQAEVRQRKRKGRGRGRKGKLRRGVARDHGGLSVSVEAADGEGGVALENGSSLVGADDVMGDGSREENGAFCAVDEVGMKANGVGDAAVRGLSGIGSPRTDGVGQFEDDREFGSKCGSSVEAGENEAVELKPVSSSGPELERELRNGGDVDAHGNGDASSKDGEHTPLEAPRKRRRLSAKVTITPDMPLRRSARRAATATALSDPYVGFSSKTATREKRALGKKPPIVVEDEIPAMPPSSKDLEIDGLPVLDVFSVYSCLRSFSTLIFLSPFSLKAFVAALKCNIANSLIDAVHYSILQALKPHLEALSEEGSKFASNCLR